MKRAGMILRGPAILASFHLDCEEHGITSTLGPPLQSVVHQKWVTPPEAFLLRGNEGARLVEKAKDGRTALVEWITWEPMKEKVLEDA